MANQDRMFHQDLGVVLKACDLQAVAENEATPELLTDPMLEFGVLLRLVLMTLLSLVFWHAPALVFWEDMPVGN